MAQILRNLISNALKFTEEGEVRVTARTSENGASIIFSVRDTGIGIAPEHHERIFEEFSQVDTRLQKKVKGTGLGLSLSRSLARLLGGDLTIESSLGQGSIFSLKIPASLGDPSREMAGALFRRQQERTSDRRRRDLSLRHAPDRRQRDAL